MSMGRDKYVKVPVKEVRALIIGCGHHLHFLTHTTHGYLYKECSNERNECIFLVLELWRLRNMATTVWSIVSSRALRIIWPVSKGKKNPCFCFFRSQWLGLVYVVAYCGVSSCSPMIWRSQRWSRLDHQHISLKIQKTSLLRLIPSAINRSRGRTNQRTKIPISEWPPNLKTFRQCQIVLKNKSVYGFNIRWFIPEQLPSDWCLCWEQLLKPWPMIPMYFLNFIP